MHRGTGASRILRSYSAGYNLEMTIIIAADAVRRALATKDECATCGGTGTIREGTTDCPDCKGKAKATKQGVPTFGQLMAQDDLMEELPEAFDSLQCAVWWALSYEAKEAGEDPKALVQQSLDEFGMWLGDQLDEAMPTQASKKFAELAKSGRVLSTANEKKLREAMDHVQEVLSKLDTGNGDVEDKEVEDDKEKKDRTTKIEKMIGKVEAITMLRKARDDGKSTTYSITKADESLKRTTGVMYVPDQRDFHNEFVTTQDLEDAVANYVKSGDLTLRFQHDQETASGQVTGIMAWPYESDVVLNSADGAARTVTLPAGTVYASAEWDDMAWELVKNGKLTGFSLGGTAVRVKDAASDDELPMMGA